MKKIRYKLLAGCLIIALLLGMIPVSNGTELIFSPFVETVEAAPYDTQIPLEWNNDPLDNMMAEDHDGYGLLKAKPSDTEYTLQLYQKNSSIATGSNGKKTHYIRKLKGFQYAKSGIAVSGSDIASDTDATITIIPDKVSGAEIKWNSSDERVVKVDKQGVVQSQDMSGFARITATLTLSEEEIYSISFPVVVVPEFYVIRDVEDKRPVSSADVVIENNTPVVMHSNIVSSKNDLDFQIYRVKRDGTNPSKNDVTSQYIHNIYTEESTDRIVIKDMPVGKYYIIAYPKNKEGNSYLGSNTVRYFALTLTVNLRKPADSVILSLYNKEDVYDTYDMTDMYNSNITKDLYTFTLSPVGIADVKNGEIVPIKEGKTKITADLDEDKWEEYFGVRITSPENAEFDIDVSVVHGIVLNTAYEKMYPGAELQLFLTSPQDYTGKIDWSVNDPVVASVDEYGIVKALKPGSAVVTAKIKVEGITRRVRCRIDVLAPVDKIVLKASKTVVPVSESVRIQAEVTASGTNPELDWTISDESILGFQDKFNLQCTVYGKKPGRAVVTAVDKNNIKVASIIITVTQDTTSIVLSDTEVKISKNIGYYQLYAIISPQPQVGEFLEWKTSNPKVVTVDQFGKVKLIGAGTAVITAVAPNGLMAQCTFVVTEITSSIVLDAVNKEMLVGETFRITYSIKPANTSNTTLRWTSSNPAVATVDASGVVTAKGTGQTVITATASDGSGIFSTCNITVKRNATSVKTDIKTLTMGVGDYYYLEVTLSPADSTDAVYYESTNTKAVAVSKKGKLTAKGTGTSNILVKTSSGLSTYCTVTVVQEASGITIDKKTAEIEVGEKVELTATLTPKDTTIDTVTWSSSDTAIASVNKRGEVKGIAGGKVVITATTSNGGYTANCIVTVKDLNTIITLNETNYKLGLKKTFQLTAQISGKPASNKQITWSSDKKSVVTVTQNGMITGIKEGSGTITCKATDGSGAKATCDVRVITQVTELEVEPTYITLVEGKSQRITASIRPGNATYASPVWSVDNTNVAIVNSKGVVTGIKAGKAVVSASANDNSGLTAICYINVIAPIKATSVTLSSSEVIMVPGESKTIPFTIVPTNTTEFYVWSSDNTAVATVDQTSGKITARTIGTANVTCMTESGVKGTIQVYVVGLSRTHIELEQYSSSLISLQVEGAGASNINVRWDTDNQLIAEVTNGRITAKALGTTKVYAVVNGRWLQCTVKVVKIK